MLARLANATKWRGVVVRRVHVADLPEALEEVESVISDLERRPADLAIASRYARPDVRILSVVAGAVLIARAGHDVMIAAGDSRYVPDPLATLLVRYAAAVLAVDDDAGRPYVARARHFIALGGLYSRAELDHELYVAGTYPNAQYERRPARPLDVRKWPYIEAGKPKGASNGTVRGALYATNKRVRVVAFGGPWLYLPWYKGPEVIELSDHVHAVAELAQLPLFGGAHSQTMDFE